MQQYFTLDSLAQERQPAEKWENKDACRGKLTEEKQCLDKHRMMFLSFPTKRALSLWDFGDERGRRFLMLSRQARGKAVKACRRHRGAQDSMIPTHQAAGYRAVTAVELKSIGRAALINTTLMAAVPEASGAAPHHPAQQLSTACSSDVHLAIIPGENSE